VSKSKKSEREKEKRVDVLQKGWGKKERTRERKREESKESRGKYCSCAEILQKIKKTKALKPATMRAGKNKQGTPARRRPKIIGRKMKDGGVTNGNNREQGRSSPPSPQEGRRGMRRHSEQQSKPISQNPHYQR